MKCFLCGADYDKDHKPIVANLYKGNVCCCCYGATHRPEGSAVAKTLAMCPNCVRAFTFALTTVNRAWYGVMDVTPVYEEEEGIQNDVKRS